ARETLPEAVRDLPSFGAYALLWGAAWTTFAMLPARPASERVLLLLIAFLVPIGLMLHVWNVGRHGLGGMEIVRVAIWPPEWWSMWWPRAFRRPTDLWTRLPWPARFVRIVVSAFFFAIPALIVLRQWLANTGRLTGGGRAEGWIIAAEGVVVLGTALVVIAAIWWARRQELTAAEAVRILLGATTASSSWSSLRISRLLAPATGKVRPPDRDSPADHRRAIKELLTLLPSGAAEAGNAAVTMADRVLRAIELREQEIAALARDASVSEVDRLTAQVTALGETSAGDSQEHRELRELVRHQLDLVHRMRGRLELASQQRARLLDLLRGLWTQLCVVCDAPVTGPSSPNPAIERVREICAEIAAMVDTPVGELALRPTFRPARVSN
ncbi:MAG: hypothetical protein WD825_01925, partial [Gemmatimonadaceae bacterium]